MKPDSWEKLLKAIEDSDKKIPGLSETYVRETKRFAQRLYEAYVLGNPSARLGAFTTAEEFESAYTQAVFETLERHLRTTREQAIKRTIIDISEYFRKANPNYRALFPIIEEPVHTPNMYDIGSYSVLLKVLLPDGKSIPLGN